MVIVPKAPPFFTKYGFTVGIEEIALLSLFELIETSDNTSVKRDSGPDIPHKGSGVSGPLFLFPLTAGAPGA